jgi:photosystem II stability/assembly factor-like uncharacterized protein
MNLRTTVVALLVAFSLSNLFARQTAEKSGSATTPAKAEAQKPAAAAKPATDASDDSELQGPWKGMQYRLVGPFRGGRVVAASGVVGQDNVYYFGAVAGGVWKTTDGGMNWKPIFDKVKEASPSIGALAVASSDPNVIYVGTGEACIRGNIVGGNGVFKSIDAGATWKFVGLADTHSIGRLIINPQNPDIAFVAALGHPYAENQERGVFRTRDGGKTWEKVLYKDSKTGAIDITFDPTNANILYAAMWQAKRTPWSMDSGGPGSGLYKSIDGGTTWKEIKGHGLPETVIGRIGVSVSGANPNRVYAVVEADKGGIFKSDDAGETWRLMTDDHNYRQRAWYYSHIFADPKATDTVYILNTGMYRSTDGGKTFNRIRAPHGDNHALWIDPTNPKRLINGNDGGATVSTNGGETWTTIYNQPTAQFYHVSTDTRIPYFIYGAQQDNSTVAIASASPNGSIDRSDWYPVGGGESGYVAADPTDPNIVYAGSYGGEITRYDHRTEQEQAINPWPINPIGWAAADVKHRFQWTEPIVFSPHDPKVLYFGGEMLFKTADNGMSWTTISPDLTRNDKAKQAASGGPITKDNTGVEVYDTIFSVVESPVQKGLIWAGTDDGLVHVTRDGGQHWDNVTPKAMPEWGTVSMIDASVRDAGTAYMAVERHKMDDSAPYIFKTTDFGKTWTKLTNGIPASNYVHAVRMDPQRPGLLFAGTEQGVYVSFDDGAKWQAMQINLPVSPVNDLVVKGDDLVVATHGRSFWVLDNISPLRQYADSIPQEQVHLFTPEPASRMLFRGSPFGGGGATGKNPPAGAVIYYWLKDSLKKPEKKDAAAAGGESAKADGDKDKKEPPKITLEILDASGKTVRKFPKKDDGGGDDGEENFFARGGGAANLPTDAGLNRFVWDLRYEGSTSVPKAPLWGGGVEGPVALPGNYQVKLTVLDKTYTAPLQVTTDPRLTTSAADLTKQFDLLMKIHDSLTTTDETINQIRDVREQINVVNKHVGSGDQGKPVVDAGKALNKKMTEIEDVLIQSKAKSSQDVLNYPVRLNNHFAALGGVVGSAETAPTQQSYEVYDDLTKQLNEQLAKWKDVVATDIPAYNNLVKQQDVPAVKLSQPGGGK